MRKMNEGITLISLTITIIVMIILATILIEETSGIDDVQEAVNLSENTYETKKTEVEQNKNSIEQKWGNVINKKSIDNAIN